MQIKYSMFRDEVHARCNDLAALAGCKPYVMNQTMAKLVGQRLMDAPYENQGEKHIPLASFYVLSKQIKFPAEIYEEIIKWYQITQR